MADYTDLGYAKIDHDRENRCGLAEVVYCPNKAEEHILGIVRHMHKTQNVFLTRIEEKTAQEVLKLEPEAVYNPLARTVWIQRNPLPAVKGKVAVLTGGTADIPVAEEAAVTCEVNAIAVDRIFDVGVAGLHRLLDKMDRIKQADLLICVAGMEGALASVVGGLVSQPVIAVPTSVGYGANFSGLSALLAMLNSCASGVTVVNIDNGFGAAMAAGRILRQFNREGEGK